MSDSTQRNLEKIAIGIREKIRKQLSVTVRSAQWSYGIFWSPSEKQNGKLEWRDGYYNGDIKTRKTILAEKVYDDTLGFCRSDQLRELFESKDTRQRRADVLSQNELSGLEKYYVARMSHTFKVGECSHGKVLNASQTLPCYPTDKEAKKASVKTVICLRHEGGVLELGVTDLVKKAPYPEIKSCLAVVERRDVGKVLKIREKDIPAEVKIPSRGKFSIEVMFPPTDHLVHKIKEKVGKVKGLVNPQCKANLVSGIQTVTIKADEFDESKPELEQKIEQLVREAIRDIRK